MSAEFAESVALRKLRMLDAATTLLDLRVPPANRFEKLKGRRAGHWAMQADMTPQLVTDARLTAVWRRGRGQAVLHHSDQAASIPRRPSSARADIFDCIERFYNPRRRHSTLGYVSPITYEAQAQLA